MNAAQPRPGRRIDTPVMKLLPLPAPLTGPSRRVGAPEAPPANLGGRNCPAVRDGTHRIAAQLAEEAGGPGLEPGLRAPKARVLPLHHPPVTPRRVAAQRPILRCERCLRPPSSSSPPARELACARRSQGPPPAVRAAADPVAGDRRAGRPGPGRWSWWTTRSGGSRTSCPTGVVVAVQEQPRGTGDAVAAAGSHIDATATVVVINGDVPLITRRGDPGAGRGARGQRGGRDRGHDGARGPRGYGRIVRDKHGNVERVVETKGEGDATPEQLAIREVNTGVYAFDGGSAARRRSAGLEPDNAQGELYLPDVLPEAHGSGKAVHGARGHRLDAHAGRQRPRRPGARSAARAAAHPRAPHARRRDDRRPREHADRRRRRRSAGTPSSSPTASLRGATKIGEDCAVGPCTTLIDATLGDGVSVPHSYLVQATVEDHGTIGPFAYLRPDAHLHPNAKAGAFVEIKNSTIGSGTKVPHLSYIGDADIGENTNIGASQHHRELRRRTTQAPDQDRVQRPDERGHCVRGTRRSRRRRLHRRRQRDHRGRPRRRARHRPGPPEEHRGLCGAGGEVDDRSDS